ncbi:MAG: YbaB/EbfC family nucleoid-associated protein [bacterium]|nr:YbaB/EbfC family nucleoid-associated protein [bacterium]
MKGAGDLLRNLQRAQAELNRVLEEMAERRVEATAGGGMVRAVATGRRELVEVIIDPQVVDPADVDILQDLIRAAVNEALRKAEAMLAEEMTRVTGASLPGLS